MSQHYWREPLVLEALHDEELDLCGVLFVGNPRDQRREVLCIQTCRTVEALDADGAFITTEGFGNNHIDFASHHGGIPVVGLSFCAVQGALVVGNPYMTNMVDNNKSESGIENEVLACDIAIAMLKAAMAGEEVKPAEKKWNPNVKANNIEMIEKATGTKIDLVARTVSPDEPEEKRKIRLIDGNDVWN